MPTYYTGVQLQVMSKGCTRPQLHLPKVPRWHGHTQAEVDELLFLAQQDVRCREEKVDPRTVRSSPTGAEALIPKACK